MKNLSIVFLSLISVALHGGELSAQTQTSAAAQESELSVRLLESLQNAEATYGWKTAEEDGKFEFTVQISPKSFMPEKLIRHSNGDMKIQRQAFLLGIPSSVQGRIQRIVVRLGEKPVYRQALEERTTSPLDPKAVAETPGDETYALASPADERFAYLFDPTVGQHQGVLAMSPEMLSVMLANDKEFASNVKPSIAKKLTQLVIVVGRGPLPTSFVRPEPSASSLSPSNAAPSNAPSNANADAKAESASEAVESLTRKCEELERRTRQLAANLRNANEQTTAQKSELEKVVREAFATNQALRRAELSRRMQLLHQAIDARDKLADKIVERRMEVLLNPSLEWEENQESN